MPSVNFVIKSDSEYSSLYVRVTHTRDFDVCKRTGLFVNSKMWDKKNQILKDALYDKNSAILNSKLTAFKGFLVSSFNMDYMEGVLIDKYWVEEKIKEYFKRPKEQPKPKSIYYTKYAQDWLDNKADKWRVSADSYMSERGKSQYQSHVKLVEKYEKENYRIKFDGLNAELKNDFASWLSSKNYQYSTIKRHIKRFHFFSERAREDGLEVNSEARKKIFIRKPEEIKEPYLNEEEIDLIYKYDFSYDKTLDNVRDNFIIGLWTGLRVSDFLYNLNTSNINNDYIDIQNIKTGKTVSIPLHWQVKEILNKRNGELPRKISDVKFNKHIKTICFIVGIDNMMKGKVVKSNKKTKEKRKVVGEYEKWKLVSSHICRRSFATNLYGKIPNQTLMAVCGWSSEQMMLNYIKKSSREHADQLKKYWETVKH